MLRKPRRWRSRTSSAPPSCARAADSMDASTDNAKVNLLGLSKDELEAFVGELGSKPFRARQLMNWLYKRGEGDIAAMTDLAKDFRAQLLQRAEVKLPEIVKTQVASDGTRKWLLSGGKDRKS